MFKIFTYRFIKFMWMVDSQQFEPIIFNVNKKFSELISTYEQTDRYFSEKQRDFQRMLYGQGEIVVPKVNCFKLFLDEVLNPFYLFQVFSIAFWFANKY